MQAHKKVLIAAAVMASLFGLACSKQESASDAILRSRGTLIDAVTPVGTGVPFYTVTTLNPTWEADGPIVRIPEMKWTDHNDISQNQSLFLHKTTVVAFVFTSCSGFCPVVIQELKKVEKAAKHFDNVQFVVFTVDPEFDTPSRLKSFAQTYEVDRENWFFLTASKPQIHSLIRDTFASQVIQKDLANGRDFVHAGHFYLFDDSARLRAVLNGTEVSVAAKSQTVLESLKLSRQNSLHTKPL